MPQLNLFYYPHTSFALLFFYFIGYFFFFKWVLGQLILLVKVKNYLIRSSSTHYRSNPLSSTGFGFSLLGSSSEYYEFSYGESLLFVVEFILLVVLLVKMINLVMPDHFNFEWKLYTLVNPYPLRRINLVCSVANVYVLLAHFQGDHFYQLACQSVVKASRSVLFYLDSPLIFQQRAVWVENLFQVFIPKLQRTCRQIGPE